ARERLSAAEQKLAKLEIEDARLKKQGIALGSRAGVQARRLVNLEQDKQALTAEIERIRRVAGSALALDRKNKNLKARTLAQGRELQALQQENEILKDRGKRDWFLAGAGVLVIGLLLGLILPRLRLRRRGSWNSF
ncbi:MAG TPA: TIGR04211 family SH3 domain-containing protein, partial [Gammaproteobacteria bacterium]|nr:TIGR04211 family SH3 domain-containing protein [Gammaproteobacteria bacterium]